MQDQYAQLSSGIGDPGGGNLPFIAGSVFQGKLLMYRKFIRCREEQIHSVGCPGFIKGLFFQLEKLRALMEVLTQKRRTAIIDKKRNMMDCFNLPDPLKCKDFLVFQIGIDRVQGALEGQFSR